VSSKFRPYCQFNYVHSYWGPLLFWIRGFVMDVFKNNVKMRYGQRFFLTWYNISDIMMFTHMGRSHSSQRGDSKEVALREQGVLHPHPEVVRDEVFRSHEFFDPRDLLQVRYEMLRRHRVEGRSVSEVARCFGLSRQAFYKALSAFKVQGVVGLMPRRRGPRRAHKCTDEILDFVEQWAAGEGSVVEAVEARFGIRIHPRWRVRSLRRWRLGLG